jgi:hypothetical protein
MCFLGIFGIIGLCEFFCFSKDWAIGRGEYLLFPYGFLLYFFLSFLGLVLYFSARWEALLPEHNIEKARELITKYPQFKTRLEKMIKDIEDNPDYPTIAIELFQIWFDRLEYWEQLKRDLEDSKEEEEDIRGEIDFFYGELDDLTLRIEEAEKDITEAGLALLK